MSTRRRAREIVLQLLYEADAGGGRSQEDATRFIRSRMQGRGGLTKFAAELLQGTLEKRDEIDTSIAEYSTHWKVTRMPVIDRNILRLGVFEIKYSETPGRVAVNEAVILAKRYGDVSTPRFINGVLDRFLDPVKGKSVGQELGE